MAHRRMDLERLINAGVAESTERQHSAPGRHGTGVMMAALRLVPRIALLAIEAQPGTPEQLDTLAGHSGEKHVRGKKVFDTGPTRLCIIREGDTGPFGAAVVADHHRRFVVEA